MFAFLEEAANAAKSAVEDAVQSTTDMMDKLSKASENPQEAQNLFPCLGNVMGLTSQVTAEDIKTPDDVIKNLPAVIGLMDKFCPTTITPTAPLDFTEIEGNAQEFYKTLPPSTLEDASLSVPNLIAKNGYPSEIHTISTEDGYHLALHRIPYGQAGATKNRRAILLVHNILSSSADFVVPGPKSGLAYLLADAGYDVWLANCRGNRYSRKHNTLSTDDPKFWGFSFNEMGIYDCPAMVDYILTESKQPKLYYVGHGQGSAVAHILLSEKPEYNKKVAVCVGMGPMEYMKNEKSPLLRFISQFNSEPTILAALIGEHEFLPNEDLIKQGARFLPADSSPSQILCTNVSFIFCGFTPSQMNPSILPVIMGHTPAGCSSKQVNHITQEIQSGKFCKWDYGLEGNKTNYQADTPPDYILSNVICPNLIFYSPDDWLSDVVDVKNMVSQLGADNKEEVEIPGFRNLDYMYGVDAPAKVYKVLIDRIVNF